MSELDPRIELVRNQYGLSKTDFWKLPQGKDTWLVKHAALPTRGCMNLAATVNVILYDRMAKAHRTSRGVRNDALGQVA